MSINSSPTAFLSTETSCSTPSSRRMMKVRLWLCARALFAVAYTEERQDIAEKTTGGRCGGELKQAVVSTQERPSAVLMDQLSRSEVQTQTSTANMNWAVLHATVLFNAHAVINHYLITLTATLSIVVWKFENNSCSEQDIIIMHQICV